MPFPFSPLPVASMLCLPKSQNRVRAADALRDTDTDTATAADTYLSDTRRSHRGIRCRLPYEFKYNRRRAASNTPFPLYASACVATKQKIVQLFNTLRRIENPHTAKQTQQAVFVRLPTSISLSLAKIAPIIFGTIFIWPAPTTTTTGKAQICLTKPKKT